MPDPGENSHDRADHNGHDHNGHDQDCGHHHGLTRSDEVAGVSDRRLLWSVLLNQLLTVGQVIAGFLSGSVSLLSDAAHNFSDANSLLIAYVARKISRRSANERYTFGYRRAELIGATINLTLLGAVGVYLIYEAIHRFFQPQEIVGWLMAAAAGLALVVDLGTALLLWAMSRGSLNVRAAFIHNLVDALGSVAVLIGAAAVIWLQWNWIDPLLTLLIAGYVLWQVVTMLPQATRVLMEGAPVDFEMDAMLKHVQAVEHVVGIHHVHVWELDEQHRSLEAHIVIPRAQNDHLEEIKDAIKQILLQEHDIRHSTLEFEYGDDNDACRNPCVLEPRNSAARN